MTNYTGDSKNTVTSSYLFSQFQAFYTKIKGLLEKKSDVGHTHNSLKPLMSNSYSGIYAEENNFAKATFYFGTVLPNDYNTPWRIKYKINSYVEGQTNYSGNFTVELIGSKSARIAGKCFNAHTEAKSLTYHTLYSATSTGIANEYGHAIGIGLRNSSNATSSSYQRTFEIDILEMENCTFTFLDTMTLYADINGTGSTNYSGYTEYDGFNNGLQETGDSNNYNRLLNSNVRLYAGTNKIFPYTLIMEKSDGKWESLVLYTSQATTKSKNTSGFRPENIYYYNNSNTLSSDSATWTWSLYEAIETLDFRWSTNCGTTLTAYKPVYLVGTMENGLFYLIDTWYTQTLPTSNDGYVYVYLGTAINTYQITLNASHPMYVYRNGYVQEYVGNAETVNGHTVLSDVPEDAKFTDTTYSVATASKSGLMSYEDKIKLDTIETGALNYELPVATEEELGGIQLGYEQTGKNYPVQVQEGKAFVEVLWENTWRGVQNNLTSSSTTDSLSANQGKVLKGLIDTKAPFTGSTSISKLASSITLGDGGAASIVQNSSNYQQKITIEDNANSGDAVFTFKQSTDAGNTFQNLLVINDDSSVKAQTFIGDLAGTAENASQVGGYALGKGEWGTIPYIRSNDGIMEIGKSLDFHNDAEASNDYDTRITSYGGGVSITGVTKGTFEGDIAGTATKAIADENGNNIADTYIKDLTVVDNNLVMTNGSGESVDVMELPSVGTSSNLGLTKLYAETGSNTDGSMTQSAITTALAGKSNTNHNHDSKYLSLENGGTVKGRLQLDKGSYITVLDARNTTIEGYMHVCTLTIKGTYVNTIFKLSVSKRSGYGDIFIKFANSSTTDPNVEYLRYSSNILNNIKPYMVKSDTSTWELYLKATEHYDAAAIVEYSTGSSYIVPTWTSGVTLVEDIGEDYIEGTLNTQYQNIVGNASTASKATQDSSGQQINSTYIKGITASGTTLTITKGDGSTSTITTQDTDTTYSTGTASVSGLTKLYGSTGSSTDGTMTRKAITNALATKTDVGHTHTADECGALDVTLKGAVNGVAELDSNGKVPSSQLPSYVDDTVEGYYSSSKFYSDSALTTVITGESGKIYVDKTTNKTYRWSGSVYVEISASLALGETSSTAYRGDRGKIAYTHSQSAHAPSNAEKNIIVGIQKNGTDISVDSSSRKVNITVPTKISELENDSNFQSTIYGTGTPTESGITKLYTEKGTNIDGTMTQNAITEELTILETALDEGLKVKSNVGHTHSKKEIVDLCVCLTNEDLDSIKDVGYYYAGGSNTCTNKPKNIDAFGLEVIRSADGWRTQKLYDSNKGKKIYIRWFNASTWGEWTDITVTADHTHNYLPLSGDSTINGTIILNGGGDLSGTAFNNPALSIGSPTGSHIEMDANEIQAKSNKTTTSPLYLNNDGGQVFVGGGGIETSGTVKAPTFKGSLTGNSDTATKLATPKTIALNGAVTGTATSFDGSSNITIPVTSVDADKITGVLGHNTYINTHGENSGAIIPFINNDLAFMLKRGGSYSIYYTDSTDYTALELNNIGTPSWSLSNAFNGSGDYNSGTISSTSDVVVIDINLPYNFTYTNKLYYDAGGANWRAKNVQFLFYNTLDTEGGKYVSVGKVENSIHASYSVACSYNYTLDGVNKVGFNRWRIVLTNFNNKTPRIAGLGIISYSSIGLRVPYMSRGEDDPVWRHITPYYDNTYSLGSSSNRWNNVYAKTFTGALVGNADTATSATSATKDSSGQQIDSTYIKGLSVNGKTITYTKGDGTTGSFDTKDTTYSAVSGSANGLMTPTLLAKLNGIAAGAEVNVQADWNATSGDAMILNKPTIPEVIFETEALDLDLLV